MIETKNKVKTKASETKEHIKEKTVDLKEKAETVAKNVSKLKLNKELKVLKNI